LISPAKLCHRPGPVDRDEQGIAAGLHEVFVRVGEGRQQRQVARVGHDGGRACQVIEPVRLARHGDDLRSAHTDAAVSLTGH
jgi:hypothetical protein